MAPRKSHQTKFADGCAPCSETSLPFGSGNAQQPSQLRPPGFQLPRVQIPGRAYRNTQGESERFPEGEGESGCADGRRGSSEGERQAEAPTQIAS